MSFYGVPVYWRGRVLKLHWYSTRATCRTWQRGWQSSDHLGNSPENQNLCGAAQKGQAQCGPAISLPEDHVLAILASSNVDNLWNLAGMQDSFEHALPQHTLIPTDDSINSIYFCACDGRSDHVRAPLVELCQPWKSTYSTVHLSSWDTN